MIRRFSLFDLKSKYDEETLESATEYLERVRDWILWQRPDREKLFESYFRERWELFLVLAAALVDSLKSGRGAKASIEHAIDGLHKALAMEAGENLRLHDECDRWIAKRSRFLRGVSVHIVRMARKDGFDARPDKFGEPSLGELLALFQSQCRILVNRLYSVRNRRGDYPDRLVDELDALGARIVALAPAASHAVTAIKDTVEGALYAHDVEAYAKEVDGLFPELVRIALS